MNNKKLIFIVNSPRSGSTLLLSYFSGLSKTKILYETKKLLEDRNLVDTANYFDSWDEEIVIEKTPEHVYRLEDIEKLRKLCTRDIYVISIVRPPVPTILSILKHPEIWGEMDLLGACEKYESSLLAIYNNLILKNNESNYPIVKTTFRGINHISNTNEETWHTRKVNIPYSLCITYRELTQNPHKTLESILNTLHIEADVQSLIDNRIDNTLKAIPQIVNEEHHKNVLKTIEEVELGRDNNISKQLEEGVTKRYRERFDYIRNYFEHPISKETIYDLVVNKKKLERIEDPLVTIVVPLYNKQEYVEETLSSIANQTYKNIRVVIVDDGSTDSSLEITRKFIYTLNPELQRKFSDLCIGRNRGVAEARNIGLSSIQAQMSDIISFCDADDIWDSTLVEKSVDTFRKYPYVDCVYSRVLDRRDNIVTKSKAKICNGNVFKDATQYNFLECGSNLFIKSEILKDNDIEFNTFYTHCEDWDFLIQLSKVAVFKCTKEYLVTYRRLEDSLSSNRRSLVTIGKNILQRYVEDKKEYKKIFTRLFLYYLSSKNFTWNNIQDLDFEFIIRVFLNKFKSFVKSYISKTS